MEKPILHNSDIFGDALENFKDTNLHDQLVKEFTPLPYYKKYRVLYLLGLVASYLFNVFSGFTASALVYFFFCGFIHWMPSLAFTGVFLLILELSIRKSSKVLFKDLIQFKKLGKGLLFIVTVLSIFSVVFSYFGAKKVIYEFTGAAPTVVLDTIQNHITLETKIKELDKSITEARETKWNNTTTRTSQETINELTPLKTALELELSQLRQSTTDSNEVIKANHQSSTGLKAEYFAAVTLLLECLFLGCQFWIMTYKYNSLAQFSDVGTDTTLEVTKKRPLSLTVERESDTYGRQTDDVTLKTEPSESVQKSCLQCGNDIEGRTEKAKFCSDRCRKKHWSKTNTREPYLKAKK